MIITRSTSIIINPAKHLVYTADPQPDMSEMLEGTINIEESVVTVKEN